MITVACLTSLIAHNGKNHAGTGIPQLFTFTQPLKRAQDDAFGPPSKERWGPEVESGISESWVCRDSAGAKGVPRGGWDMQGCPPPPPPKRKALRAALRSPSKPRNAAPPVVTAHRVNVHLAYLIWARYLGRSPRLMRTSNFECI